METQASLLNKAMNRNTFTFRFFDVSRFKTDEKDRHYPAASIRTPGGRRQGCPLCLRPPLHQSVSCEPDGHFGGVGAIAP